MLDPLARPPLRISAMLRVLHDHEIDWVLSGSTVLAVYGADVEPNDLAYFPGWAHSLSLAQCRAWNPQPPTLQRLDHLFVTRLGMLDVPPKITGSHAQLRAGATRLELSGVPVWVCDLDEVLRRLPQRPRAKDRRRAVTYAAVQQRLRTDRRPYGIARFP